MRRTLAIPIVEVTDNGTPSRVAGHFCSTLDAVTTAELEALAQLRRLHQQAQQLKQQLSRANETTAQPLQQQLQMLRQEAKLWQERRRQASFDKLVALGHIS
ncbi:MAG: hypothetical protein HQL58_03125 [Magnetococcales bacterium]|nr:hypothetical protein [Magnetococcales bacterium]